MKYKKHLKKIMIVFTLVCVAALFGVTAYAANDHLKETILPDSFVIADEEGIRASKDGAYMIAVNDIDPGDVITKTITLRHMENGAKAYNLYMTAEPVDGVGPVDLGEKSSMRIELDGEVVYTGPVQGITGDMLQSKALDLGKYSYGDTKIAHITITIDNDWTVGYEQSKYVFRWNFYASKDEQAVSPKTGDILRYALYVISGCIALTAFILLFMNERRKKREQAGCEKEKLPIDDTSFNL